MKESEVNIEDRVKKVLLGMVKRRVNPEELDRETPIIGKGLGLDSVGVFNLVVNLEKEFDIFFEGSEIGIEIFENLGSLVNYINDKIHWF